MRMIAKCGDTPRKYPQGNVRHAAVKSFMPRERTSLNDLSSVGSYSECTVTVSRETSTTTTKPSSRLRSRLWDTRLTRLDPLKSFNIKTLFLDPYNNRQSIHFTSASMFFQPNCFDCAQINGFDFHSAYGCQVSTSNIACKGLVQ